MHPKKAFLYWNVKESLLVKANNGLLKEEFRFIGSSASAVSNMVARDEMMKALMPSIISLSGNSPEWDKRLRDYWASTMVPVAPIGMEFDLSFTFDVNAHAFKDSIATLSKLSGKKFETSDDLSSYLYSDINGNPTVPFDTLFKYGIPNNPFHYVLYVYTQKLSSVANHYNDVDKAPQKIKFYYNTEEDIAKTQKELTDNITKAIMNLSKIISDADLVENLLQVLVSSDEFRSLTTTQARIQRLKQIADVDAVRFNKTCADKHLNVKAEIERYIHHGVFRRLEGSSIVVDATNPTDVIGNNTDEVIVYLQAEANSKKVAEYKMKLKQIKSKV